MNFDGELILFDSEGAAAPSLHMCERVWDLVHKTIIMGDISHSGIARIVKYFLDEDAHINTPSDLEEVSTVIDLICFCFTSYATN